MSSTKSAAAAASRRKSSAGDRGAPPPPEPPTLAAARQFVGRRVVKVFLDEAAGVYRPYGGQVDDVMGAVHRPDKGVDKRFHFLVRYEDGDSEHMLWPELCKVLLPEEGGEEDEDGAAAAAAPPAGPKRASGKRQAADARGRDTVKDEPDGEAAGAAVKPDPAAAAGKKRRASGAAPSAAKAPGAAAAADDGAEPASAVAPSPLQVSTKRARKGAAAADGKDDDDVRLPDSNPADGADADAAAAADKPAVSDAATISAGLGAEADGDADGALAGIDSRMRARGLPGHLRRVRLRNFMCHANFEMEFGPHVNVVSGTNGSGKSAVLQAIQACLGASAKVTGRATSLGDFVRTGAPEALVSVELWNGGEDGYDRARLGDCVTIERRIAAGTGASSWRVLSSSGKAVATGAAAKKRLIDPLLDHLSVNASNPMAAMTQDTARTFLSSGATGPQRRFELFMEATMLALFKTNLDAARSYAAQMASRVQEVQREHSERVAKQREAERKLRLLDEAKQLAANRAALERAAAWALAAEGQAEVRALRDRVQEGVPGELERLREGKARTLAELDAGNKQRAAMTDQQSRAVQMATLFAERAKRQSKAVKDKKALVQERESDLKAARRQLADAEKKLKQRQDAEKAANAARRAEVEPLIASQVEGREALARRAAEAAAVAEERQRALAAVDVRLGQLEDAKRSARASAAAAAAEQARLADWVAQTRGTADDALAPYPTRLLRERVDQLQASGRSPFKSPPIGPIGAHVTLDKPEWHTAAVSVAGGALDSWIVGHAEDQHVLQRLAREVFEAHPQSAIPQGATRPPNRVAQVLVRDYGAPAYDIRPEHKPAGGFGCVLDALRVSHPTHAHVVRNALVDTLQLERVALAETAAAADNALQRGEAGPACAKFVDKSGRVLQRYGPTVTSARAFAATAALTRRLRGTNKANTLAALEADRAQAARRLEDEERQLADLSRQIAAVKAERVVALQARREAHLALRKSEQAVKNQENEIKQTQQVLDQTAAGGGDDDDDDDEDEDGGGGGGGGDAGTRELKALRRARDKHEADFERDQSRLADARTELEGAEAMLEAAEAKHRSEGGLTPDELDALGERIADLTANVRALQATSARIQARVAVVEQEARTLKPVAEAAERELLPPLLAAARSVCPDEQGAADLARAKEVCYDAERRRLDADTSKRVQRLSPEDKARRAADEADAVFCAEWVCEHLDALDDRLREAEEEAGGSRDELEHDVAMRRAENRRQATVVRNLVATNNAVQAQVTRRARAYEGLFNSVEATVRNKFELFMARRHHNGTIKIRRDAPALDILVVPNGARQQGGGRGQVARDLRQLSGGERSFTTVAFMLALGEWTESPFRAADELDVFMDAVNRRVAVEAVLEFAAERDHLQMVLLTPQDLQAVEDAKASLARRRAKRARQARRQAEEDEAAAAGEGGGGGGAAAAGDDDDEVDPADEAAAALPDGFVRVLKMPAAREQGGVRRQQQQMRQQAAGGGGGGDDE